jgi:rhamnulokinase
MPEAIAAYCRRTGQRLPGSRGAFVRALLESLALKYRQVIAELGRVLGHPVERVHVIGGGAHNGVLCQLTADATGLPVVAGPAEATAVGNMLVQAMALGRLASPAAIREVVRYSFNLRTYTPAGNAPAWDAAAVRFKAIAES